MAKSLAETVAVLPPHEQEKVLADLNPEELKWNWDFWSRPEQRPPKTDDWAVWIYLAGRGAGKTRSAAEWVREKARINAGSPIRFGLIARTSADVRDVIVEGESGIMNITPPSERPEYHPSKRSLVWPNGNVALCFSADEPDQLRGPQFHYSWCDELAAWRQIPDAAGLTAWDNVRIATRLGAHPQIIATTTPKRTDLMRKLLEESKKPDSTIIMSQGRTLDNVGNLSSAYLEGILGVYSGTRLARQELEGLMLDDVEGALWNIDMIDDARRLAVDLSLPLRVVGVDPTVAEKPGDECGIVVVASTSDRDLYKREAYVLEDASVKGAPEVWASQVVRTARRWGAPVIAEINQGGALVRNAIHQIDPGVPVLEVRSQYGKALRAEPVVLSYEQGRVHHLGVHAELEQQMISWVPEERKSPDRVDALVHALTALLIKPPSGLHSGPIRATSPARRRLPPARTARARVVTPGRRPGRVA